MNTLGLDTATPSTAVAVARADGWLREARDEVAPGQRPAHAQRLLVLAAELLEAAQIGWAQIGRVAVGVGPGGYTGLRIGLASAHGIALAHGAQLVGVGTLRALAEPVTGRSVAGVLDARRDLAQPLGGFGVDLPAHREVVVRVDGPVLRGQIADMAERGVDVVVLA